MTISYVNYPSRAQSASIPFLQQTCLPLMEGCWHESHLFHTCIDVNVSGIFVGWSQSAPAQLYISLSIYSSI